MMAGAIWYALNTQGELGELSLAQLKKLVEGEGAAFSIGPSGGQRARTRS